MQCEMCGNNSLLYLTDVEGTFLKLCKKCSTYGNVKKVVSEVHAPRAEAPVRKSIPQVEEVVVDNFAELIRAAREKNGMKQEDFAKVLNEKESLIHHVETGRMQPDIKLAKKIEHFFGITLVEEIKYQDPGPSLQKNSSDVLTLGDIITLKKR